ncbi:MAG: aspartate-semialdehyde dehydrogenase [Oceanospirillaceae bacterium]|jgi:aspartate-semialdehyde dehydrogenase
MAINEIKAFSPRGEIKMVNNIAVIGRSGALGSAFIQPLTELNPDATIHAFSRSAPKEIAHKIVIKHASRKSAPSKTAKKEKINK